MKEKKGLFIVAGLFGFVGLIQLYLGSGLSGNFKLINLIAGLMFCLAAILFLFGGFKKNN